MNYYPVRLTELPWRESFNAPLNLALRGRYFAVREMGQPWDEEAMAAIRARGEEWVYIRLQDYDDFLGSIYREEGRSRPGDRKRYLFERLLPIHPHSLKAGSRPAFHLLTVDETDFPVVVVGKGVREASDQILPEHLQLPELYVRMEDQDRYLDYLREICPERGGGGGGELTFVSGVLHRAEAERCAVDLFAPGAPTGEALGDALKRVAGLQRLIVEYPTTYYDLLKVSGSPARICLHSVNVAVLSMGLGMAIGMSEEEIRALGVAGLFHDIGKRELDPDLLHTPGRLNEGERRALQDHALLGEQFCLQQAQIGQEAGQVVGQHHERLDGSGYPRGVKGGMLSPSGQILALMEIYDALTLRQPNRAACKPFIALAKIIKMGEVVNQSLFGRFIRHLGEQTATRPILPKL